MSNEIERAINLVEELKPSCGKCFYKELTGLCDRECQNPDREELFDVVLQALREQLERENCGINKYVEDCKDCGFCKEQRPEGWIKTSERLPQKGERVIGYWDGFVGEAYLNVDGFFFRCGTDVLIWIGQPVTHWRPLPEPPKEVHP